MALVLLGSDSLTMASPLSVVDTSINYFSSHTGHAIANFKNTWLSENEEIQFLGAQRVPSWDLFCTEEVSRSHAMSELVGKSSVNFSGIGENSVSPKNCFTLASQ